MGSRGALIAATAVVLTAAGWQPLVSASTVPGGDARPAGQPVAATQPQPKAPATPPSKPAPTGAWLDAPPSNWNETLKSVPPAPKPADAGAGANAAPGAIANAGSLDPRCKEQVRSGNSAEDRLVTAAGWTLVGARQIFNDITLVTAMSGTDGMCRPLGYQAFVFVGGAFAGTLAPVPMDSRTDGMVDRIFLTTPDRVTAEFRRYKETDALCCPSGGSGVTYHIDRKGARPLLVPEQATPAPR